MLKSSIRAYIYCSVHKSLACAKGVDARRGSGCQTPLLGTPAANPETLLSSTQRGMQVAAKAHTSAAPHATSQTPPTPTLFHSQHLDTAAAGAHSSSASQAAAPAPQGSDADPLQSLFDRAAAQARTHEDHHNADSAPSQSSAAGDMAELHTKPSIESKVWPLGTAAGPDLSQCLAANMYCFMHVCHSRHLVRWSASQLARMASVICWAWDLLAEICLGTAWLACAAHTHNEMHVGTGGYLACWAICDQLSSTPEPCSQLP